MRRFAMFGVCAWVAGLAMIAYAANAGSGGGGSHAMTAHGPSQPTGGTSGRLGAASVVRPHFQFKLVAVKTVSWSHDDSSRKAPRKGPGLTTNSGSKVAQ